MIDLKLAEDVATYGRSIGNAVETILDGLPDAPAWSDRLRFYFTDCIRAPHRALRQSVLTTAVRDLVTFDAACHAYSVGGGSLEKSDRGGALTAKRALGELLTLAARHDAVMARDLAIAARLRSDQHVRRLEELFAIRA